MALAGPERNAATAGEGLGLRQLTVDTDMRKTRPFCKVDSELNQMVKALCGDDGFQPEPEFLQVSRHFVLVGTIL